MNYNQEMKLLECHHNWAIEDITVEDTITDIFSKKTEQFAGHTWTGLLVQLNLVYELCKRNRRSEAEKRLKECLDLYEVCEDQLVLEYKPAFQHVFLSFQLFWRSDKVSDHEIKKFFNEIPPYSTLSQNQKAAVIGIKAYCIGEYGSEGRKQGLILAREAHKLNPNEPEWYFMIGIALSRIRGYNFDKNITDEEFNYIKEAYTQRKSSYFGTYLAQTYLDYVKMILYNPNDKFKKLPELEKKALLNELNGKSYDLIREILAGTDEKDIHIMSRCARSLYMLRGYKPGILNEALDIINKCLKIAPNYGLCHTTASSVYTQLKRYDKALEHSIEAEKNGDYYSSIRIIKLKYLLKIKVNNAAKIFDNMLRNHPTESFIYQTHLFAMSYFIFMERNLPLAVKHFLLVSKLSTMKREHYVLFDTWTDSKIDLCKVVYNEVKCAIDREDYLNDDEKANLEEAYEVFKSKYPDVIATMIDYNLVDKLKTKSVRN